MLTTQQLDELRIQQRLLKDVRSAREGRQTSIERLKAAQKQGLRIPTLEEAMAGQKAFEKESNERGEAHNGQAGQISTAKSRRVEKGKKTKGEVQAEGKVKEAMKQKTT